MLLAALTQSSLVRTRNCVRRRTPPGRRVRAGGLCEVVAANSFAPAGGRHVIWLESQSASIAPAGGRHVIWSGSQSASNRRRETPPQALPSALSHSSCGRQAAETPRNPCRAMTYRPLIAVTTTMWPGGVHNLPRVQLNAGYIAAVEAPGATAVLLTPAQGEESIRRILGVCHGLLLTGGEDVDPLRYGQTRLPQVEEINPERDEMELAAVH